MSLNFMSFKKIVSPVLALTIAAGSLLPLASAANAREWQNRSGHVDSRQGSRAGHASPQVERYSPRINRWGDVRHDRWNNSENHYNGGHRRYREHKRDHTGRNIALGAFAAILGLAIAAETAKVQRDYYDND